jgi:hypothetical protein
VTGRPTHVRAAQIDGVIFISAAYDSIPNAGLQGSINGRCRGTQETRPQYIRSWTRLAGAAASRMPAEYEPSTVERPSDRVSLGERVFVHNLPFHAWLRGTFASTDCLELLAL